MKKANKVFCERFYSKKKGWCIKGQPVWTDGEKLFIKRNGLVIDVTSDEKVFNGWGEAIDKLRAAK